MKILHLLSGGGIGGIEVLCRDIADLSKERHEFCFLYSGGEIADEMKKKKQHVYFLYKQNLLKRVCNLIKVVKKEQYDTIVVHHEGMGIYLFYLILTFLFRKIRFIKYLHCSFEKEYFFEGKKIKDWLNYNILKSVLKRSDRIIAVSEFVKNSYCNEFYCDADKVVVIYNGIHFSKYTTISHRINKASDEINLLYIGRLIEVKGVRLLLYSIKKLIDAGKKVSLTILGDGPQFEEYTQLVGQLSIKENVNFEGIQLNKKHYYQKADIFVYPSVWQEAFGISIVEALAAGMICVASLSGGIPEIIEDGADGFLFERNNVDSLTEAILKAADVCKSSQNEIMIDAAKQKARQFDINKMVNELERICR